MTDFDRQSDLRAATRARKRFGQHFLIDSRILDELVACIAPRPRETLVEIGPGRGALTSRLLESGAIVHAVEIDRDLVDELSIRFSGQPRLYVHTGDALEFDFHQLATAPPGFRIVGNLPYNISTPLLLSLLKLEGVIEEMCFMLQKEVAERLVATPGHAGYGRLSVMTQAFCTASIAFDVPPTAFAPPPRVDSSVVLMRVNPAPACRFEKLESVVATAFAHRRKMLRHTLGRRYDAETLAELNISITDRPENLSVAQYVALTNRGSD